MKREDLPFLHYLVPTSLRRTIVLLHPAEVEDTSPGGVFVAPLRDDGSFFSVYRFEFSIYLGGGQFLAEGGEKRIDSGIAVATRAGRRDQLVLTFEIPWAPGDGRPRLPGVLRDGGDVFIPRLNRRAHRASLRYVGKWEHRDFSQAFAELEPTEPRILDEILDRFSISLIGCDLRNEAGRAMSRAGIRQGVNS